MDKDFNWHDYLKVSDRFGNDKRLIERALDDIAATGADGQALIKQAFENFSYSYKTHKPVEIFPDAPVYEHPVNAPNSFVVVDSDNHVNGDGMFIKLEVMKHLFFHTADGWQQQSLTGMMVHELFHLADFNRRGDVLMERTREAHVVSTSLNDKQRIAILKLYNKARDEQYHVFEALHPGLAPLEIDLMVNDSFKKNAAALTRDFAECVGVPAGSFTLPALTDLGFFAHSPRNPYSQANHDKREQQATAYADVFMAKYFTGEPWRGNYFNLKHLNVEGAEVIVRKPGIGIDHPGMYVAEDVHIDGVGDFKQPPITLGAPKPPGKSR